MAWHVFHGLLHPHPDFPAYDVARWIRGALVQPVVLTAEQQTKHFALSFHELLTRWQTLPHALIEPDGSFGWSAKAGASRGWQRPSRISGVFYEREDSLYYAEFFGEAVTEELAHWLKDVGLSDDQVIVQLPELGLFVTWGDFLKVTATDDAAQAER
ncbi:MAG: hypothetical protein KatS3mg110_4189 [Pirellulaceae bacterium]|nr:MAG: hypothetical protein KatS3mg110_4189 [Pirellulaceae bacterium]